MTNYLSILTTTALKTNARQLFFVAVITVFSTSAQAAIYAKFDGIDGSATDAQHQDWSNFLTTTLAVSVTGTATGGGRTRAAPVFEDFAWMQDIDQSYPSLFSRIVRGEITRQVDVDYTFSPNRGGRDETYFSIRFDNVVLTGLEFVADASEPGRVFGRFAFEQIELTYYSFIDGSKVGEHSAAYDLRVSAGTANFAEVLALGLGPAPASVPIPAAVWMLLSAVGSLIGFRRRVARS